MNKRFNELGYQLPSGTPEEYADNAVNVLTDLIDTSPKTAVDVMEPSSVLLFGRLRAISPYHEFSPNILPKDKQTFDRTLGKYGIHRVGGDNSESNGFILFSEPGIDDVKHRYSAAADQYLTPDEYDRDTLLQWMDNNERNLRDKFQDGRLPTEWQNNSEDTARHLQFGMLLGYPGTAISSAMWVDAHSDPSSVKQSWVAIAESAPYHGSAVALEVDPSLVDNAEITAHKKLWTETLRIVYQTLQFEELMKNEEFAATYNQPRK